MQPKTKQTFITTQKRKHSGTQGSLSVLRTQVVKIRFKAARCKGCGFCVDICPTGSIKMSTELNRKGCYFAQVVNAGKCTGCALCYRMCPDLVIEIEK